MARNHGALIKWLAYSGGVLLLSFLEQCVLNRLPIYGCTPVLAILAVVTVACFEGCKSGSILGLCVGVLCALVYYRAGQLMIPVCTLAGLFAGATTDRQMGRTLPGVLLCDLGGLLLLEGVNVCVYAFFWRQELHGLLRIAVPEGLYSFLFALPVYALFCALYHRFRTDGNL